MRRSELGRTGNLTAAPPVTKKNGPKETGPAEEPSQPEVEVTPEEDQAAMETPVEQNHAPAPPDPPPADPPPADPPPPGLSPAESLPDQSPPDQPPAEPVGEFGAETRPAWMPPSAEPAPQPAVLVADAPPQLPQSPPAAQAATAPLSAAPAGPQLGPASIPAKPEGYPRAPQQVADLGIPDGLLEDLFMRRLLAVKRSNTREISQDLSVSLSVVQQVSDELRDKGYLEYLGLDGRDYRFTLTEAGQAATIERLKISLYASHVPVSLAEYHQVVESQRVSLDLDQSAVRGIFSDLVMPDRLIDKIGFGLLNDGAMFLYGPPGTGKTSIAERMGGVFDSPILVPHCMESGGQIVMVFDPVVHRLVSPQPAGLDPRWVLCERPLVIVGGELGMAMLDLTFEQVSGVYSPPIQLLANNGILVIDDFGRQTITPEEILNRWIVPLSRDVDFLRLNNGAKITVPFAVKLVVSSNFDPNRLGDDAFLRRLRNKVYVGPCTEEAFDTILLRAAADMNVQVLEGAPKRLREVATRWVGELRPYIAVDFCELLSGMCRYRGIPAEMTSSMIDEVADVYFIDSEAADANWSRSSSLGS